MVSFGKTAGGGGKLAILRAEFTETGGSEE